MSILVTRIEKRKIDDIIFMASVYARACAPCRLKDPYKARAIPVCTFSFFVHIYLHIYNIIVPMTCMNNKCKIFKAGSKEIFL